MQSIPPDIDQQTVHVMDFVTKIVAAFHNTQDFDKSREIIKKDQMDRLGMIFVDAKASDMNRLLLNLMRTVWNNTPLASNRYRPSPLPELNRNDKCWCGSGLKYKQCCLRDANMLIPIDSTTIWSFLLQALSPNEIKDAMKQHAIPTSVLVYQAIEDVEAGDYRNALKKLEPLFDQRLDKADEETCYAVNLLCNSYDDVGGRHRRSGPLLRGRPPLGRRRQPTSETGRPLRRRGAPRAPRRALTNDPPVETNQLQFASAF